MMILLIASGIGLANGIKPFTTPLRTAYSDVNTAKDDYAKVMAEIKRDDASVKMDRSAADKQQEDAQKRISEAGITLREVLAELYVSVLGNRWFWVVVITGSPLYCAIALRRSSEKHWTKRAAAAFAVFSLTLSVWIFTFGESISDFLSESNKAFYLHQIVTIKTTSAIIAIVSGGLVFELVKACVVPEPERACAIRPAIRSSTHN